LAESLFGCGGQIIGIVGFDFSPVEFGDYPMLKRCVRFSLISIAVMAVGIPISAVAYIALALIGF
jgi:hypothetical protein